MKSVTVLAALVMLSSAPVLAQAPEKKPATSPPAPAKAVPQPAPAAPKPAAAPAEKPAATAPAAKPEATATPAAKPEAATAPTEKPVEKAAKPLSDKPRRSRANEDARECLKLGTNREIANCAQKFL